MLLYVIGVRVSVVVMVGICVIFAFALILTRNPRGTKRMRRKRRYTDHTRPHRTGRGGMTFQGETFEHDGLSRVRKNRRGKPAGFG